MKRLSLLLLLLGVAPLRAHVPMYRGMDFLTQEDKSRLQKVHVAMERERIRIQSQLRLARLDLQETLLQGAAREQVRQKFDAVQQLQAQLRWNRLEEQLKIREILGEEKYAQFREHRRSMRRARAPPRRKPPYPSRRCQ
ncbi:MAG: hypothetical protein L3J76_04820 [Candidatus Hydrothermae bacterium]|nr:hypothetical protein [Candidatus Hydrothermae bacterium]